MKLIHKENIFIRVKGNDTSDRLIDHAFLLPFLLVFFISVKIPSLSERDAHRNLMRNYM